MIPPSRMPQTGFMTAPAGISPWVTYLQRAMSSLRASATIEMRRVRPRSEPTRWRNQPLRALSGWYLTHIQASSIIVARKLAVIMHRMWADDGEFRWSRDEIVASAAM